MSERLAVVDHPVLADRLAVMRDRNTSHGEFRQALFEASAILAVEAARGLPVTAVEVETPLEHTTGSRLPTEITIVPVLRAGLGMVDGFLRLLPGARVGHVGVYRDEEEHRPVDYYERLPPGLADAHVFVLDKLKAAGARQLALVCLVVAPEGVEAVEKAHPDVQIWTAAIDRELDENAYIRPGLGDAGDRVFGTQ
jgi:uracil phosphoribosyltransferase